MIDKVSPEMLLKQMEQIKESINVEQMPQQPVEGKNDFQNVLGKLIKDVDSAQKAADTSLKDLASGDATNIQDVVMKMEQADLSFQLMKQIRDKLLAAYKEVLSMSA